MDDAELVEAVAIEMAQRCGARRALNMLHEQAEIFAALGDRLSAEASLEIAATINILCPAGGK